jgi:hypothetical protein
MIIAMSFESRYITQVKSAFVVNRVGKLVLSNANARAQVFNCLAKEEILGRPPKWKTSLVMLLT